MLGRLVANDDKDPAQLLETPVAEMIRRSTGTRRIASVDVVQRLWSGYGHIYRCGLEGAEAPSVVVKHVRWPAANEHPRGWNTDVSHQRKVRSYEVETHWYTDFATRCANACRVPRCLASQRLGDEVVLVLEDLDAAGFPARRRSPSSGEIEACLRWLAEFHATFMGASPAGLWPVGTYWHLDTRPDELAALAEGPLKRAAAELDARLSGAQFLTLVHGDAKLANFCFPANGGRVAAVDFQYVGGGCGMKDVAYFMSSCLDEHDCERQEDQLLDLYFDGLATALRERTSAVDPAAVEREWRALYPVAWTDFYRFLQGWSPGHPKIHGYSERLAREVLTAR